MIGKLFKFIFILLILGVFIIGGGYVGLWFYYAGNAETTIAQAIDNFNAKVKDTPVSDMREIALTYDSINVSGFPFSFTIAITNPNLMYKITLPNDERFDFSTELKTNHVQLDIDIFGNEMTLTPSNEVSVIVSSNEEENLFKVVGDGGSAILELSQSPFDFFLSSFDPNPLTGDRIPNHFKRFYFGGGAGKVIEASTTQPIMLYGPGFIDFTMSDVAPGKKSIHMQFKGDNIAYTDRYYDLMHEMSDFDQRVDELKHLPGMTGFDENFWVNYTEFLKEEGRKSGSFSYNVDISYQGPIDKTQLVGPPEFDLAITQIAVQDSRMAFNSDGQLRLTADDPLPHGWYRLQLVNYKEFIRFYTEFFNIFASAMLPAMEQEHATGQSPVPIPPGLREINENDRTLIAELLANVGTVSHDEQDITILVQRGKAGQFYIGDMPYMKFITMAGEYFEKAMSVDKETSQLNESPPVESTTSNVTFATPEKEDNTVSLIDFDAEEAAILDQEYTDEIVDETEFTSSVAAKQSPEVVVTSDPAISQSGAEQPKLLPEIPMKAKPTRKNVSLEELLSDNEPAPFIFKPNSLGELVPYHSAEQEEEALKKALSIEPEKAAPKNPIKNPVEIKTPIEENQDMEREQVKAPLKAALPIIPTGADTVLRPEDVTITLPPQ